jgi:prepilin-type N-terminal cleavage/methylation domain-containing protein
MEIIENHQIINRVSMFFYLSLCMKKTFVLIKSGFTLIEIILVIVVITILMTATMKFGSNRIIDLKSQSLKEHFIGYYNELYSQNITSSFRDQTKYQTLTMTFKTGFQYYTNNNVPIIEPKFSVIEFTGLMLDTQLLSSVDITLVPYVFGCTIASAGTTGDLFSFRLLVPENGKQYCFEIASETCKLIEKRCI